MAQPWRPCAPSLQAPPQPVGGRRSFSAPPLAAAGSPSAGLAVRVVFPLLLPLGREEEDER
uniref:Uncharacterized protein n=1 Tax=Oryza nivara TaxID=4536 RepID=A0A0E0HQB8_ORYNI